VKVGWDGPNANFAKTVLQTSQPVVD